MGRYLAAGVAVKIAVYKRGDCYTDEKVKDYKKDIIDQIGKFIDLSHFKIKDYDDFITFNMDTNYFNKNIHEDYCKFKKILNLSKDSYKLDYCYNEEKVKFDKENFPITLFCDSNDEYSAKIFNQGSDCIDVQAFASNRWIFYGDEKKLFSKFMVIIEYVCIYRDIEQIYEESDRNILTALNVLSNHVFNDGLTKDISFYISG